MLWDAQTERPPEAKLQLINEDPLDKFTRRTKALKYKISFLLETGHLPDAAVA